LTIERIVEVLLNNSTEKWIRDFKDRYLDFKKKKIEMPAGNSGE